MTPVSVVPQHSTAPRFGQLRRLDTEVVYQKDSTIHDKSVTSASREILEQDVDRFIATNQGAPFHEGQDVRLQPVIVRGGEAGTSYITSTVTIQLDDHAFESPRRNDTSGGSFLNDLTERIRSAIALAKP